MGRGKLIISGLVVVVIISIALSYNYKSSIHLHKETKNNSKQLQGFNENKAVNGKMKNEKLKIQVAKKNNAGGTDNNKTMSKIHQSSLNLASNIKPDTPQKNVNNINQFRNKKHPIKGFEIKNNKSNNDLNDIISVKTNKHNLGGNTDSNSKMGDITDDKSQEKSNEIKNDNAIKNKKEIALKKAKTPINKVLTVHFKFDQYKLDESELSKITNLITSFNTNEPKTVNIKGYTDNIGLENYNKDLSLKRALYVSRYIKKFKKENFNLINCEGLGETQPISDNSTQEGRAKNRRDEITFTIK